MSKKSRYTSRQADASGFVHWPEHDNDIWRRLVQRQTKLLDNRACDEYMHGLSLLALPETHVPQLSDINAVLNEVTGWQVAQVPALINFDEFFRLLANKQFPVATFSRSEEEFDYLQEPDVFHEIFGHCPLLTNPAFAHFTHVYGKLGYQASREERVALARLYWFTVEFGLILQNNELRIYGGGILSSPGETTMALEGSGIKRVPMNMLDVMRTPYRIDIMQPVYYVLQNMDDLFELAEMDLLGVAREALQLGLFPPLFPPKQTKSAINTADKCIHKKPN